jgi:hypothetical protein
VPWQYVEPLGVKDVPSLLARFKVQFARLSQQVKAYEPVPTLTYGTTVQVPGELTRQLLLEVTDGVAFTIAAPTRPREGVEIVLDIYNNSGGAMGAITWNTAFKLAAAFTNPANTKHRLIAFYRAKDSVWRELYRSTADLS